MDISADGVCGADKGEASGSKMDSPRASGSAGVSSAKKWLEVNTTGEAA